MRTGLIAVMLCACSFHAGEAPSEPDATPPNVVAPDAPPPAQGPYPIVLAHGLFGFSSLGPLDYFYGISDALTANGRKVYAPRVDAVQSAEVRGAQLVMAIEAARLDSGADKVIVIGHSQGGMDARWAAAHDPDAIAAVVTVATPNRGSPVADVALGIAPGDSTAALDVLGDFFGISTNGSSTSFAGALQSLSSAGAAQFNADTPDVPTIPYFSVAGRSNLAGNDACAPAAAPFMATWDGDRDPIGAELVPIVAILAAASLPSTPTNDGLVTVDSATWGQFLGCVPADHLDEVCQVAGQSPGLGNSFDCLGFWRGLEQTLRSQGL
jgi:triacylglycerol lipase